MKNNDNNPNKVSVITINFLYKQIKKRGLNKAHNTKVRA